MDVHDTAEYPAAAVVDSLVTSGARCRGAARFGLQRDGTIYPLPEGETTIGRGEGSAIIVDSMAVSRAHAKIVVAGSRVTLHDLGSRNGTFVGGLRVDTPTEIVEGNDIRLGPVWFTFCASAEGL